MLTAEAYTATFALCAQLNVLICQVLLSWAQLKTETLHQGQADVAVGPAPSSKQHLSNGDCPEGNLVRE